MNTIEELRKEASINSLCGSKEWTSFLNGVSDELEAKTRALESLIDACDNLIRSKRGDERLYFTCCAIAQLSNARKALGK